MTTKAVRVIITPLTGRASWAIGTTTIDASLLAVLDSVCTGRYLADPAVADPAGAIGAQIAGRPVGTGRTVRAAAIDVGLLTVLDPVATGRRLTDPAVADPAGAIAADAA